MINNYIFHSKVIVIVNVTGVFFKAILIVIVKIILVTITNFNCNRTLTKKSN